MFTEAVAVGRLDRAYFVKTNPLASAFLLQRCKWLLPLDATNLESLGVLRCYVCHI